MECIEESRYELNEKNNEIITLVDTLETDLQKYGKAILNKSSYFMNLRC